MSIMHTYKILNQRIIKVDMKWIMRIIFGIFGLGLSDDKKQKKKHYRKLVISFQVKKIACCNLFEVI